MREHLTMFVNSYRDIVGECLRAGELREARGKKHRALFNVIYTTRFHGNLLVGGVSRRFAIAELMGYIAGWDDVMWLAHFNKNVAQFSDDGHTFHGAYGPRMAWSWGSLFELLKEDPYTRQAVCQIYEARDLQSQSKDKPCNVMFQLQVIDGCLDMTVYQRSCDLIWGLPYDHFSFSCILYLMANELELEPGRITRLIANAHIYEPNAGYATEERIFAAAAHSDADTWLPIPKKFSEFRIAAIQTRTDYECQGAEVRHPMLMKELR